MNLCIATTTSTTTVRPTIKQVSGSRIYKGEIFTEEQMGRARRGTNAWLAAGSQGIPVPDDLPRYFTYEKWRHGGWYVHQARNPSGSLECVTCNYTDKKWRIASGELGPTYRNRDAAACAAFLLTRGYAEHK